MDELLTLYKQNVLVLYNNCNVLINQIKRSNTMTRVKNIYISNAIRNYNVSVASLKTKYMAELLRIQQQQQQIKKRRALLVGINYYGTPYQLAGCITDVQSLNDKFGSSYDIEILTDLTNKKPTRSVILSEFSALLESANSGDTVLFAFSGHGSCTTDLNHDEIDEKDEMIISCDLYGVIDDDFKTIIRQKLKTGATLVALFDSCHSGTMIDLKYSYPSYTVSASSSLDTIDTAGTVILISGCLDDQTSAEANIDGEKVSGAMTWSFLKTLKQYPTGLTWNALLTNMRTLLNSSGFNQIPQLSSGRPLNTLSPILLY
jgi:hypothetical protein